jgi:hypothetical protein
VLRGTADCYPAGTVVCVRDPDMKQAWCLAASSADATACDLTGYYGSRWALRLGCAIPRTCASAWGWAGCTSARPNGGTGGGNALAVVLSTLLAAASEAVGYGQDIEDKHLQAKGTLAVSTGLHGLRPDPHNARALATPVDVGVCPDARLAAVVQTGFGRSVIMRGVMRVNTSLIIPCESVKSSFKAATFVSNLPADALYLETLI